jgi:hypothetical protein
MTPGTDSFKKLLGLPADEAESILRAGGYETVRREYSPKRSIEGADSERVIRIRPVGNNSIEMLVSRFKTLV